MNQLKKFLNIIALVAITVIVAPLQHASSQELGIVAIVNDQAISAFDLTQRMQVAITTARLPDSIETRERLAPQILRALIDETLQLQQANLLGLDVTQTELNQAISTLEKRNNVPAGGFELMLENQGLEPYSIIQQIKAEIAWGKILRSQISSGIQVSEDQIDEAEARIRASEGKHRLLISEIFLAIDQSQNNSEVYEQANRILADLKQGADFGAIARQFSQGASMYQAGDIGWVLEDQLNDEISASIQNLKVGELSEVIAVPGGIYIILLRDRQIIGQIDPFDLVVSLKQIALLISEDAEGPPVTRAISRAESISLSVKGCEEMDAMIEEIGNPQSGDLGQIRIGDMPPRFRDAIVSLNVGEASKPVRSSYAVHVFMACERIEPEPDIPSRNEIAESIWDQQVEMLTRRLLRDLRRSAVIEIR